MHPTRYTRASFLPLAVHTKELAMPVIDKCSTCGTPYTPEVSSITCKFKNVFII